MMTVEEFNKNKNDLVMANQAKDIGLWHKHINKAMDKGENNVLESPLMTEGVKGCMSQHLVSHGWCYRFTTVEVGYDGGSWETRVEWKVGPLNWFDRINGWNDKV